MVLLKERERRLVNVKIDEISPNPNQPRKTFDEYELHKLSESIKQNGIIVPLNVRKTAEGFELIAGERRLRAAKAAGLKKVPCVICGADDQTSAVYSIIENLQRADLSVFEQAEGISRLISEFGLTHADAAERLGLAQSTLSNKLRVLRLDKTERERITAARLSERHARALIRIENAEQRGEILNKIIAESMTAKECEDYIEAIVNPERSVNKKPVRKSGIADFRIFSNSLNRLIDTMLAAGVNLSRRRQENRQYIEYRIRIEKPKETAEEDDGPQLKLC